MSDAADLRPVVVGIDGSERSKSALRWAAQYARVAGMPLHVLVAWHMPPSYGWAPAVPEDWNPETDATSLLEAEITEVLGADPGVDVRRSVVEGHPAQVLTDESKSASVVVVGSRGRGEFAGMLLGSVSAFVTTHAHCPVVVVRDGTEG